MKRLAADGTVVSMWGADGGTTGRTGTAPGEFSNPVGVAVDASGNVFVVEYGNHRIQKFSNDGTPIAQWGTYGTAPGQFRYPQGIAVTAAGDIYVADTNNLRIQILSADGAPRASYAVGFWPDSVWPLGAGSFVATAFNGGCASRLDLAGGGASPTTAWAMNSGLGYQHNSCGGVAVDIDGSILTTSQWWAPNSSPTLGGWSLLRIDAATGVASNPFGTGASTCVLETYSGAGDRCLPRAVAVEPSGTILVTDVGRNRVVRLERDGTVLATWG